MIKALTSPRVKGLKSCMVTCSKTKYLKHIHVGLVGGVGLLKRCVDAKGSALCCRLWTCSRRQGIVADGRPSLKTKSGVEGTSEHAILDKARGRHCNQTNLESVASCHFHDLYFPLNAFHG
jgi:hypothetical protein